LYNWNHNSHLVSTTLFSTYLTTLTGYAIYKQLVFSEPPPPKYPSQVKTAEYS